MPDLLQHIAVTFVAFGAAAVIFRRVAGLVRSPRRPLPTACANCPSAAQHHPEDVAAASSVKPLTLVRR